MADVPQRLGRCRRRWRWWLLGAVGFAGVGAGLLLWGGPALAPWILRRHVLPSLARRTHRHIRVGSVRATWHQVELRDLTVAGPQDCPGVPLLQVSRVKMQISPWALLRGRVVVTAASVYGPQVCMRRLSGGRDNFSDLLRRARGSADPGRLRLQAEQVSVHHGTLRVRDEEHHLLLQAAELGGRLARRGRSGLVLQDVRLTGLLREPVRAQALAVRFQRGMDGRIGQLVLSLRGGRAVAHDRLVLTDIAGQLRPLPGRRLEIRLQGSYGDAGHRLWQAWGTWPASGHGLPEQGRLKIRAERFTLDKLGSVLPARLVANPEQASLALDLALALSGGRLRFDGAVSLSGLTVVHPWLSRQPVRNIGFEGAVHGFYDRAADLLRVERAELRRKGVRVHLGADVYRLRSRPRFWIDLWLDRVDCARLFRAMPPGLLPDLSGMQLAGVFDMRLHAEADFKYLTTSSVTLTGTVHHRRCHVVSLPYALSAERLAGPFLHEFADAGRRFRFEVGPDNPDFVPLDQVSPYVIGAILTTEDSRFFFHHGFIPREFQSAFARNLIARRFVFGASSITMQMVKNVLLGRRKTLSRKLQELVLTWYLERHLSKRRILEIYLNVIEFGPGIYGIERAAWHFFGKDASELLPQEAAYLASILPSPKRHYRKFCRQQVSRRWRRWVDRILKIMHRRHRLSDQELAQALAAPVAFSAQQWRSRAACLRRLHRFTRRR